MRSLNHKTVAYLARAGIVAALYALLTCVWPFSLGPIQCRVSEALCVLPYYMGAAVPGLFIGCLLGNLLSGHSRGYPSTPFWQYARKYGNDVILGVDAHDPAHLRDTALWQAAIDRVQAMGYHLVESLVIPE